MNIPVIFENDDVIALHKPAGISVHGDGARQEFTVADFILEKYPQLAGVGEPMIYTTGTKPKTDKEKSELELENEARNFKTKKERFQKRQEKKKQNSEEFEKDSLERGSKEDDGNENLKERQEVVIPRPGIVHRLDKDTSGVLLVAKNQKYYYTLKELFQNHDIKKQYIALVYGWPKEETGIIDRPIARSKSDFRKKEIALASRGGDKYRGDERSAMTRYKVVEKISYGDEKLALVNFYPMTGRMHQIRVHTRAIGHPIVGDHLYGPYKESLEKELFGDFRVRQLLHAESIAFDGKKLEAKKPEDFERVLSIAKGL